MRGYENVFNVILDEKQFFLKVFPSIDHRRTELYFGKIANRYSREVVEEKAEALDLTLKDSAKEFVAEIYGSLMITFLISWIENGMKEQPTVLVKNFSTVLHGSLDSMLQQAALTDF